MNLNSLCKPVTFSSDDFRLKGILHLPTGVFQPPVVIGSHGLLSSSNSPKQIALAQAFNALGMAFFRFDHRGCGKSEGIFEEVTSLKARCNDMTDAIKKIQSLEDTGEKIGLFGSSFGGAVCLSVANQGDITALVTLAAPVRSDPILEAIQRSKHPDIPEYARKNLRFDISGKLSEIHHILIFHGDADEVVPFSDAIEIYEKAGHPKQIVVQKKGDHRMDNKAHQDEFIQKTVQWLKAGFEGNLSSLLSEIS